MLRIAGRKLAVAALLAVSAVSSFATLGSNFGLGDGRKKTPRNTSVLTNNRNVSYKQGSFSLRSGYSFRGAQVMNTAQQKQVVRINTTVTLQRGNTTYTMPLKKNVVMGNVQFSIRNGTISNQR
jgi:hypothetical protein